MASTACLACSLLLLPLLLPVLFELFHLECRFTTQEVAELQTRNHATMLKKTGDTYSTYIKKWEV
jgi:hypothetical protein